MGTYGAEPSTRGLRIGAVAIGVLALVWGLALGVRPVAAYGVAQLAVLGLLWLYPRVARRSLSLERFITDGACEEDWVPVRFRIVNRGWLPLVVPEIEDRFAPDKVPTRTASVHPLLGPRAEADASYRGECYAKRGLYAIGPARLHASDPIGLFSAAVQEPELARLTVYPALEPIPPLKFGASHQPGYGTSARREAGAGDLTLAVREYRPGDARRRIHWPTTARRGRLTILDYERRLTRQLALFIDLSRASLRGLGRQSTLEVAVRVAAAVAGQYLDDGGRVSLHAEGAQRVVDVRPGRGTVQLCRILEELATVRPDGQLPLSTLLEAHVGRFARGQAILCVVPPGPDATRLLPLIAGLVERRHPVLAVLLDRATFSALHDQQSTAEELSLAELADAYLAHGATVFALRAGQALSEAFFAPYAGRPRVRLTKGMLS